MTNKIKDGLAVIEAALKDVQLYVAIDCSPCMQKDIADALEICQALREAVPELRPDGEYCQLQSDAAAKLLNDFVGESDEQF